MVCSFGYSKAQTRIVDSIRHVIHSTNNPQQKLSSILEYCSQYQSLNRDTAYNYALLALRMSRQLNDVPGTAKAELALANAYYLWGWVDSAEAVCDNALEKYKITDLKTRDAYFKLMRQKALCFGGVQDFPDALKVLFQLLREAEQYKDSVTIASTCNTIGSVNINMQKPGEALKWINRSLLYDTKDERFLAIKSAILTNAAYANVGNDNFETAIHLINKAIPLCREAQNLNTLATALRIRSDIYVRLRQYDNAEKDLREMIGIRQKLSNGSNITDDNIQIANFYAGTGQLEKAIAFCKQNIKEGNVYNTGNSVAYNNHLSTKLEYYKVLAGFYKQANLKDDYEKTLEEIIAAKDSFYAINNEQAIAEVQTKYKTEQKEKTILQQQYNLTKKNFIIYGSLGMFVLLAIIFYLLFREYRRKQAIKMKRAIEQENIARDTAVKEAEENERKRIAADLHDNLGVQANAILYNTELLKNETGDDEGLVENLHNTAKQMLLNLRETLWAMKANDIAAAELWVRIISFIKQMGRHYNHIGFSTNGAAPPEMKLQSAKALNVVMIVQEAVQNAVKHSHATKITITSENNNNSWKITTRDNGRGFEFEHALSKTDSHGLKNMQQRIVSGGMHLEITSNNNEGTIVQLQVNA